MNKAITTLAAALLAVATGIAQAYTLDDVEQSFYPYKNWKPQFPGYTPGMVIDQNNVDQFSDILDPAMFDHVKQGWVALQTKETDSLELHPNYIKYTRESVGNEPVLRDDGIVDNFVAGRAFPSSPIPMIPRPA